MSNEKKATNPGSLQRLDNVERQLRGLEQAINGAFGELKNGLSGTVEILQATLSVLGDDVVKKVEETVKARRVEAAKKRAAEEKKNLEAMVASGMLTPEEIVTENSVVVGRQFDKEGNVVEPGYAQAHYSQFTEEIRPQLLGCTFGSTVEGLHGKFEVLEVYKVNDNPPQVAPTDLPPPPEVSAETAPVTESVTT